MKRSSFRFLFSRAFTFRSFGRRPKLAVTGLIDKSTGGSIENTRSVGLHRLSTLPPFRPSITRNYWYPCSSRLTVQSSFFSLSRQKEQTYVRVDNGHLRANPTDFFPNYDFQESVVRSLVRNWPSTTTNGESRI